MFKKHVSWVLIIALVNQILLPINQAHAGWVWDWTIGWVYDDKAKVLINPITTAVNDAGHFLGFNYPPRFAYDPNQRSVADKIFAENVKFDIRRTNDYALIFETKYANEIVKQHIQTGETNYTQLHAHMNSIHHEYQRLEQLAAGKINNNPFKGTPQDAASTFFKALKNVGGITADIAGPTGQVADYLLKGSSIIYDRMIAPHDQAMAQMGLFNKKLEFENMADEVIQDMRNLAMTDRSYSKFMDVMTYGRVNAPITGDVDSIFSAPSNNAFTQDNTLSSLRPYIKHDGVQMSGEQMSMILGAISKISADQMNVAILMVEQHAAHLRRVSASVAPLQGRIDAPTAREQAMIDAEVSRNTLGGCSAAINILAFGLQGGDPGAAMRVREFGRATISVASSIVDFAANLANPNLASSLQQVFSGAIMTGNVVGAVMGLVGAILGGPNQHGQIMKGIGDTQKMIKEFADKFSEFTKALDEKLDAITTHLDGRFDVIEKNLAKLIGAANDQIKMLNYLVEQNQVTQERIFDIQQTLKITQARVYDEFSRLNSTVITQVDGLSDYLTASHLNFCFDFVRMFPDEDFSNRDYARCLSRIKAFAKHRTRDAVVPADTRLDEDTIFRTLTNFSPDQTVPYILNVLRNVYLLPVEDYDVGNPTKWAVAADSMIFMLSNYPENASQLEREYLFSTRTQVGLLDAFAEHGKNVAKVMGSVKSTYDSHAHTWTPNTALFTTLVDNYKNAVNELSDQINVLKTDYRTERYFGFNFYDSLDQTCDGSFRGRDVCHAKKLQVNHQIETRPYFEIRPTDPDLSWFNRMKPLLQNLFRIQDDFRLMFTDNVERRNPENEGVKFDVLVCKTTMRGDEREYSYDTDRPRYSLGSLTYLKSRKEFSARSDAYFEIPRTLPRPSHTESIAQGWQRLGDACAADPRSDAEIFKTRKSLYIKALREGHREFLTSLRTRLRTDEIQRDLFNENIKKINYHHKVLTTIVPFALPESIVVDDKLRGLNSTLYSGTLIKDAIFTGSDEYVIGKGLALSTPEEDTSTYSDRHYYDNLEKRQKDYEMVKRDLNDHYPKDLIQKGLFKTFEETDSFNLNFLANKLQERIEEVLVRDPKPETDPFLKNTLTSLEIYYNSH